METEELLPGERLLWAGEPRRRGGGVPPEVAPLVLLTVALLGLGALYVSDAQSGFAWAGPVVFASGWLPVLLFAWRRAAAGRRGVSYRITDRRLLVANAQGAGAWWLDGLPEPTVVGSKVVLGGTRTSWSGLLFDAFPAPLPELRGLADPDEAVRVLARARREALARAAADPQAPAATADPVLPAGAVGKVLPRGFVLAAGERVLWSGRPERLGWWQGPLDRAQALATPFGAVGVLLMAPQEARPFVALAVGVVVLVNLVGNPLQRRRRLRATGYVLTDQRLVTTGPQPDSSPLQLMEPPVLVEDQVVVRPVAGAAVRPKPVARGTRGAARSFDGQVLMGLADPGAAVRLIAAAQQARRRLLAPVTPSPAAGAEDGAGDGAWARWT